ncbi:MAG: hypothetical protein ACREDR_47145, partial [Blastocatellia bacterium]
DWHGAKLYFTSPARGRSILIGKNLAISACVTIQALVIAGAFSLFSGPVTLTGTVNAVFVFAIVLPINLAIGNYLSVMYPRGIDFSKIYGRSYSGVSALIGLAALPGLLLVLGIGPVLGWLLGSHLIVYGVFAAEMLLALGVYAVNLKRSGVLLEGRPEQFLEGLFTTH